MFCVIIKVSFLGPKLVDHVWNATTEAHTSRAHEIVDSEMRSVFIDCMYFKKVGSSKTKGLI